MNMRICLLTIVLWGVMSFIGCSASTARCSGAIDHILSVTETGDYAIAKLLIDSAINDETITCDDGQCEVIAELRDCIYHGYIVDRLRIAKEDIVSHGDGHAALRGIAAATNAAKDINVTLDGIDGLIAFAFFSAGCQDFKESEHAEKIGDTETRDRLRAQGTELIRWAISLDSRIEELVKNALAP